MCCKIVADLDTKLFSIFKYNFSSDSMCTPSDLNFIVKILNFYIHSPNQLLYMNCFMQSDLGINSPDLTEMTMLIFCGTTFKMAKNTTLTFMKMH